MCTPLICSLLTLTTGAPPEALRPAQREALIAVVKREQLGRPLGEHIVALPPAPSGPRYLVPVLNTWVKPAALSLYVIDAKHRPRGVPDPRGGDAKALRFERLLAVEPAGASVVVRAEYRDAKRAKVVRASTYAVGETLKLTTAAPPLATLLLDTRCEARSLPFGGQAKACLTDSGAVTLTVAPTGGASPVTVTLAADRPAEVELTMADGRALAVGWQGAECSGVVVLSLPEGRRLAEAGCEDARECSIEALPSGAGCAGVIRCVDASGRATAVPVSICGAP